MAVKAAGITQLVVLTPNGREAVVEGNCVHGGNTIGFHLLTEYASCVALPPNCTKAGTSVSAFLFSKR